MTSAPLAFGLLTEASMPILASDVALVAGKGGLEIDTPDLLFTISGSDTDQLNRLLLDFDGTTTIGDVAERECVSIESLTRALEPLADSGALIDLAAPTQELGDTAFLDQVMLECRLRTRAIFQQPFWQRIRSGGASPTLVFGWGIEFMHFVEAANEYMPLGVAHCRAGVDERELFAHHYVEEATHSEIFLAGIAACGLARTSVEAAPPLASTRALINQLSEFALMGAVPYSASFAVMQPSQGPADAGQVRAFYQELRDFYPYAAPMFDAFERHALIDVELCHEVTLLERLCRMRGLAANERIIVIEVIRALVEGFTLFFEGILDAYGRAGAVMPRRAPLIPVT